MLINLDFLKTGRPWPPADGEERERLRTYAAHKKLFENEHSEVYAEQMKRIERIVGNFSEVISFPVIFNYQKLTALKTADLVFGKPPKITVADETKQKIIDRILSETNLLDTAYLAVIDAVRYGDGLLLLGERQGTPVVGVSSPQYWFPVVDSSDIKRIQYHVFAWQYPTDPQRKAWELKVQIHDPLNPRTCEQHRYSLHGTEHGWTIGGELTDDCEMLLETKLDTCPVFRVSNTTTSDRVYGIDDYGSIDSIISEIIVRVSQISKVLDKHASPSMCGPRSAIEQDPQTGAWKFRAGDYFPINREESPVQYITWDASLDANFRQIELLINQLYTVSEMGSAIFGDLSNKTGEAPSGSALRRLMMSPLAKARRIANKFDNPLKRLASACAAIYGVEIKPEEITVTWNDGLPDDKMEAAQLMQIRTGNKPTISQHTAIKRLDAAADSDADAELEEIRADEAAQDMGTEIPVEIPNHEPPQNTEST